MRRRELDAAEFLQVLAPAPRSISEKETKVRCLKLDRVRRQWSPQKKQGEGKMSCLKGTLEVLTSSEGEKSRRARNNSAQEFFSRARVVKSVRASVSKQGQSNLVVRRRKSSACHHLPCRYR